MTNDSDNSLPSHPDSFPSDDSGVLPSESGSGEYDDRYYDWNAQVRIAVWQVDRPKLEELLRIETRWNLNIPGGDDGETILHEVCASPGDRVDIAQMLIDCGADVNACNLDGEQSLHAACLAGNAGVARLLLAHKADCYARDCDERVPLSCTCYEMHVEVARVLLDAGFDVTYEDPTSGDGPVHWVIQEVGLFGPNDSVETHRESACRMMTLFLDSGANVNAQNIAGETALHLACSKGNEQLVALLLQRGADSSISTTQGETALHYAACHFQEHIVICLLNQGADINARDCLGRTPLHQLCRSPTRANTKGNGTSTDLCTAALSMLILLCASGADVKSADKCGHTALHDAVLLPEQARAVEFARTLLKYGADQFQRDKIGDTLLLAACRNGYPVFVIELLLSDAPDACTVVDKDGLLPVDVACMAPETTLSLIFMLLRHDPCVSILRSCKGTASEAHASKRPRIR